VGVSGAPGMPIDFSKHSDHFMQEAADRGAMEIELAKLAMQKSKGGQVTELASSIARDRGAANEELQRVAAKEKLTVTPSVTSQSSAAIGALKAKSGRDFESAYAQQVAADYTETIHLFQTEAKSPDADLASYAKATLPALNQHLHMAQALSQAAASAGSAKGQ
jgi:putative membrane protein